MKTARLFLASAAFLLAGCTDRNPVAADRAPEPEPVLQRLECAAHVGGASLTCGPGPGLPDDVRATLIGGQNTNLRMTSSNVAYDSATGTFAADVSVQNLMPQAMGTADGGTADPAGVRVFFHLGPVVTEGTGSVRVSNADGEETFTAALQPFFRYEGIVPSGATSAVKRWKWQVEPTVRWFMFTVYVDARLAPALAISEIMARPATTDEAAGEWFELYNAGVEPVDLNGFTIASGGDAGYTIPGPLVIARGAYLVLGGSTDTLANGGAPVAHAYADVSLGNDTGDWLALRAPTGVMLDSVDWGAAPGESASPPPAATSLALRQPTADNLHLSGAGSAWAPGVGVFGTGQHGSPGARNPTAIPLLTIAAGWSHTCATDAAGQAWCWGSNSSGELGTGRFGEGNRLVAPVLQQPGTRFLQVVVRALAASCALEQSGRAYCWGYDLTSPMVFGRYHEIPTPVSQPDSVEFVSLSSFFQSACGLASDGQAWCWGRLPFGLTFGPDLWPVATPLPQPEGVRFSSLDFSYHWCGLTPAGQAYCAAANFHGQLGDGTTVRRGEFVPVLQPAGVTFTSIKVSLDATCALDTAGQAYCWGKNDQGQLGDGTTVDRLAPVAVQQPAGVVFTSISLGRAHTCATASSGQVYCWGGSTTYGALGNGTLTERHVPTPVRQAPGLEFTVVAAGEHHTCALEQGTGQPFCWGGNYSGQLGDGTTLTRLVPVVAGG
jgi:alpha-tubulin suppressor-like RCC1 family protein